MTERTYGVLGLLSALINATTLALIRAGVPLTNLLVASGVAYFQQKCLVDPLMREINASQADMTVGMLERSQTVSVLLCDSKIALDVFDQLYEAAVSHNQNVLAVIRLELKTHLEKLALQSQLVSNQMLNIFNSSKDAHIEDST